MSWTGEGSNLRSPLDLWRQIVPQGHDTALRNAFYNVAAAGFIAVAAAAAWNVYVIFQVSLLVIIIPFYLINSYPLPCSEGMKLLSQPQ